MRQERWVPNLHTIHRTIAVASPRYRVATPERRCCRTGRNFTSIHSILLEHGPAPWSIAALDNSSYMADQSYPVNSILSKSKRKAPWGYWRTQERHHPLDNHAVHMPAHKQHNDAGYTWNSAGLGKTNSRNEKSDHCKQLKMRLNTQTTG